MPYSLIVYPDPLDARVVLTPDYSSVGAVGTPHKHTDGRVGQVCMVPDDCPDAQGAAIDVTHADRVPLNLRGFLVLDPATKIARLQVDDYNLVVDERNPDPVDPDSTRTPEQIISDVFEHTHADLATHDGCGQFTEEVCDALHAEHSTKWGHVGKTPGQNQYNGHAVDAVMLLGSAKGVPSGTYDVILNSVSHEAAPAFNHVGPADPNLWVYPLAVSLAVYNLTLVQSHLRSAHLRRER